MNNITSLHTSSSSVPSSGPAHSAPPSAVVAAVAEVAAPAICAAAASTPISTGPEEVSSLTPDEKELFNKASALKDAIARKDINDILTAKGALMSAMEALTQKTKGSALVNAIRNTDADYMLVIEETLISAMDTAMQRVEQSTEVRTYRALIRKADRIMRANSVSLNEVTRLIRAKNQSSAEKQDQYLYMLAETLSKI